MGYTRPEFRADAVELGWTNACQIDDQANSYAMRCAVIGRHTFHKLRQRRGFELAKEVV